MRQFCLERSIIFILFLSFPKLTFQQNIYQNWPCVLEGCDHNPCCAGGCYPCGGSCPFNTVCSCNLPSASCPDYCYGATRGVFPLFTYYAASPISSLCFSGNYSAIYDNALYLITTLTEAQVGFQQANGVAQNLITYEDTFLTMNENGIAGLIFLYYNPINLTSMSNNKYLKSLTIQYSNLVKIPDSSNYFPSLANLTLSHNAILTIQTNDLNVPSLTFLDLSYNQIQTIEPEGLYAPSLTSLDLSYNQIKTVDPKVINASSLRFLDLSHNQFSIINTAALNLPSLQNVTFDTNKITMVETDAFSLTSLINITLTNNQVSTIQQSAFNVTTLTNINLRNNMLTQLPSNPFNLNSLQFLDVSYNQIVTFTSADSSAFTTWLQSSQKNTLNLTGNPLPCDSTIQWMGTFVICPPNKIIITQSETCPNGEPILDYLIPYAKCS